MEEACFICLQKTDRKVRFREKTCECKVYSHGECWTQYLAGKKECPICHKEFVFKEEIDSQHEREGEAVSYFMCCCFTFIVVLSFV